MEMPDRDRKGLTGDGMKRREFIQKFLTAAAGLPAAGVLLSGCDGGGILDSPEGGRVPATADLDEVLPRLRAELARVSAEIQAAQAADRQSVAAMMARVNAELDITWPLMVAANQQTLRANVPAEMQPVLAQLDQFETELSYSGPAPRITEQRLRDAWTRAEGLVQTQTASRDPYATQANWAFFLMVFLLFPALDPGIAANFAMSAQSMDTEGNAGSVYSMLHPTGSVSCTPCFFSALVTHLSTLYMLLFMSLGSMTAHDLSMLAGTDWLAVMMLLTVVFMLFMSSA